MQRGMGGGRMRRHCGICAIESVHLTRSFAVVICGTSDQPSEHERGLYGGGLRLTSGAEATITASKSHICSSANKCASAEV